VIRNKIVADTAKEHISGTFSSLCFYLHGKTVNVTKIFVKQK